jgi:opacity protein-like surface antigen
MKKALLLLSCLSLVGVSFAGGPGDAPEALVKPLYTISILGSNFQFSENRHWKNGGGLSLGLAYNMTNAWSLEFVASEFSARQSRGNKKNINGEYLTFNGLYYFRSDSAFEPYLSAGIGALHTNKPSNDNPNSQINLGVGAGISYAVTPLIGLRVGLNDYYNTTGSSNNDTAIHAGVSFSFGDRENATEEAPGIVGKTETTGEGLLLPVAAPKPKPETKKSLKKTAPKPASAKPLAASVDGGVYN